MTDDLIGRAEAQTAIQFAARRYTVAHEAHGEGQVVWSDNLINVTDAMNVLRDLPSAQPDIIRCKDCTYCDSDVVDAPYGMTKKVWWCDRLYAGANENLIIEPDDFCSWAERREDETD